MVMPAVAVASVARQMHISTKGGTCGEDSECSFNGACEDGSCLCDAPWKGPACEYLDVGPAPIHASYGGDAAANISSWGGGDFLFDQVSSLYHLYVSTIPGGLANWARESRVDHAVSTDPQACLSAASLDLLTTGLQGQPVQQPSMICGPASECL
eukprot:gene3441-3911_t